MEETTAHLRKTFHYPTDDSSDDSSTDPLPTALDEQEQESLIHHLSAQNLARNTLYTRLFLTLPLLSILPYLRALFSSSFSSSPTSSLLSISSLLCSAWSLRARRAGADGPLEHYLPALNAILVGVLAVAGALAAVHRRRGAARDEEDAWMVLALGILPGIVYGAVVLAKMLMASVDPSELERLRYRYKGA